MPAILIHYSFALKAIPQEDAPFMDVTNLGSQGPDAFMAYGSIPWRKRENVKQVQDFGHLMHKINIAETYLKMVEYARDKEDADMLYAYIDGLLMHYCVDRLMHAYIFYRSGVNEKGGLDGYWSWSHGYFEAILDKTFAKKQGTYVKLPKCILSDEERVKSISKMWAYASPAALGENDFYLSYLDFVGAEKLLYSPHGLKRPLFRLIGKYSTPNAQCHPWRIHRYDILDVINESHATWYNPATEEEHNESIDDMFEMALKDFVDVKELLRRARNGEDVKDEFIAWTRNLTHEGEPVGKKKHLYDLCWKVLKNKDKHLPKEGK